MAFLSQDLQTLCDYRVLLRIQINCQPNYQCNVHQQQNE